MMTVAVTVEYEACHKPHQENSSEYLEHMARHGSNIAGRLSSRIFRPLSAPVEPEEGLADSIFSPVLALHLYANGCHLCPTAWTPSNLDSQIRMLASRSRLRSLFWSNLHMQ